MIADKLRLAYPIVLVLVGLPLSFMAPFSNITFDPELVFLIFLLRLVYEAAWQVSWKNSVNGATIGFAFSIFLFTSGAISVLLMPKSSFYFSKVNEACDDSRYCNQKYLRLSGVEIYQKG